MVENLDSKSFAVRARATAELGQLGEAALVTALESNPSKEMCQRLKELLEKAPLTPARAGRRTCLSWRSTLAQRRRGSY